MATTNNPNASRAPVATTNEFVPFLVDDGTGTAYVDPSNADVMLVKDHEIEVDGHDDPPATVREFIEGLDQTVNVVDSSTRWYSESRLDVGDEVHVAGHADSEGAPDLEQRVTTAFVEAGDAPEFFVTDDPDLGLGRRLIRKALGYFLAAALLFGASYWLLFLR